MSETGSSHLIWAKEYKLDRYREMNKSCKPGKTVSAGSSLMEMFPIEKFVAEDQLDITVKSGLDNARAKGRHIGRKPTTKDDIPAVFYKHYPAFSTGSIYLTEFARICGLSRQTVYKYLKLIE